MYGLTCVSNASIPGFYSQPVPTPSVDSDIVCDLISLKPDWFDVGRDLPARTLYAKPISSDNTGSGCTVRILGAEEVFELTYPDGTQFLIDRYARRVWGHCPPGFGIDFLATYLRGPVMGFILRRRGVTALHASALSLDGRAVVLCGESESGKSTMAAALALRGAPVLCEDVAALRFSGDTFYIEPGYAQVGLWPDTVETLLGTSDALPRLTPSWEKCFLPLDGEKARFELKERPIGVIYILARRTASDNVPRIEQISPREAMLALVQNTYMNWLLDGKQRALEFDFLSTLVTHIPVRRIIPHSDPARIAELCELIVTDAKDHEHSRQSFQAVN